MKQIIVNALSTGFLFASLIFLGALSVIGYTEFATDRRSPIFMHSANFRETVAKPGDYVRLDVVRTRIRWCPGQVREFWIRGKSIVQGQTLGASPRRVTGRTVDEFHKMIPLSLSKGNWCYEPQLIYDCPDRQHIVDQIPACIEIVTD